MDIRFYMYGIKNYYIFLEKAFWFCHKLMYTMLIVMDINLHNIAKYLNH